MTAQKTTKDIKKELQNKYKRKHKKYPKFDIQRSGKTWQTKVENNKNYHAEIQNNKAARKRLRETK